LLTLCQDGRYEMKPLAQGAMVATVGEIVEYLEKHGYLLVKRVSGDERLVFEEVGKERIWATAKIFSDLPLQNPLRMC
jgi:hypothetical protein